MPFGIPHVCTAVCINAPIFITAARCIHTLKVNYTSILYKSKFLSALAFVLPTKMTKQAFDDIGFIVVKSTNVKGNWAIIKLVDNVNRTDDAFKWFANLDFSYEIINTKVIGYASEKIVYKIKMPDRQYNLTELSVSVGLDLCPNMLTSKALVQNIEKRAQDFIVPCYHGCSYAQFLKRNRKCLNYHGVEGGAVYDTISNRLLGVATWGAYYHQFEMPVGFAFANSEQFFKDYTCARRIRNDDGLLTSKGYYQSLCSNF